MGETKMSQKSLGGTQNGGFVTSHTPWAVAQTGMDDPLSRFNRHELEQFYERWMWERDRHLVKILDEARKSNEPVDDLISKAPNSVRRGIKRVSPAR